MKENQLATTASAQAPEQQLVETAGESFIISPSSIKGQFLNASSDFISSLVDDGSRNAKAKIYNAMSNNDFNISDSAESGEIIVVSDFMVYPCQVMTEQGQAVEAKRTVLIDINGKSHGSVAEGVFNSLKSIVAIAGMAPWDEPMKLAVKRIKTRRGFYTLQLVMVAQ